MERFITAINKAIDDENWYAALFIALPLPDICGEIENPNEGIGSRYRSWCERYIVPKYTSWVGTTDAGHQHIFLSAGDCYALRCACLHGGSDDVTGQKARETLERFMFVAPHIRKTHHCNQYGKALQLQVDIFCKDMCEGVKQWLKDKEFEPGVRAGIKRLLSIYFHMD